MDGKPHDVMCAARSDIDNIVTGPDFPRGVRPEVQDKPISCIESIG